MPPFITQIPLPPPRRNRVLIKQPLLLPSTTTSFDHSTSIGLNHIFDFNAFHFPLFLTTQSTINDSFSEEQLIVYEGEWEGFVECLKKHLPAGFRINSSGNNVEKWNINLIWRCKTRIIAIDSLFCPGKIQYEVELVLREINRALCGFLDPRKDGEYHKLFLDEGISVSITDKAVDDATLLSTVEEKSHYGWITSLMKFEFEFNENQNEIECYWKLRVWRIWWRS